MECIKRHTFQYRIGPELSDGGLDGDVDLFRVSQVEGQDIRGAVTAKELSVQFPDPIIVYKNDGQGLKAGEVEGLLEMIQEGSQLVGVRRWERDVILGVMNLHGRWNLWDTRSGYDGPPSRPG